LTTAGLLAGPVGVATVGAAGVLVAGGVAAVRKFAPSAANKLGLRKADGKRADKETRGDRPKGGGLGRLGLLGAAGRKKAAGKSPGSSSGRAGGLLGTLRKVAGKEPGGSAKKNAGLLGGEGGKNDATGKKRPGGLLGAGGPKAPGGPKKPGGKAGGNAGRGPGRGKNPPGSKTGAGAGGGGNRGGGTGRDRSSSGRSGRGLRLLGGAGRLVGRGIKRLVTGPQGTRANGAVADIPAGVKDPKTPKGPKGPGLLGGDKDRTKKTKRDKTKTAKNDRPRGRDTREAITSGRPDRDRSRRGHGGSSMPNPFASRTEAISGAAPLEIARANDVIDYVTHAPDHAEAQARRWLNEADTIVDKVDLTPEFAESLKGYANAQLQQVTKVREFGEVFRRSHSERLAKLERKDPREAMWDVDRNRD
jgi:hypothetical protein